MPASAEATRSGANGLDAGRIAVPADIHTGKISHLERAHRHAEFDVDAVDLFG